MKSLVVAAAASWLFSSGAFACSTADVVVKDWNWSTQLGWFVIVGELTNNCPEPIGVQLHITFRDDFGAVVDTDELWPASTRNLAAGETYAFKDMVRANPRVKTAALKVLDVHRW